MQKGREYAPGSFFVSKVDLPQFHCVPRLDEAERFDKTPSVIKKIIGRMRCLMGKHKRSRQQAQRSGDAAPYTSICTFCGVPMVRRAKGDWIVASKH
jgi:hypothetical protein